MGESTAGQKDLERLGIENEIKGIWGNERKYPAAAHIKSGLSSLSFSMSAVHRRERILAFI